MRRRVMVSPSNAPGRRLSAVSSRAMDRSQTVREFDRLGRHQGAADLELDLRVPGQWDFARVGFDPTTVVDRGDGAFRGPDAFGAEGLTPLVEELAQRVDPFDRRLDVDDPVGRVRV